jgi:NAD+ synthase (glutamine-hydrolysing)
MNHGFVKVGAAVPRIKVADCSYNANNIINMINKAQAEGIVAVAFPELSITGYTCADLFHQKILIDEVKSQLERILKSTKETDIVAIIGAPVVVDSQMFNCGIVIQMGKILGVVPKSYIPGYKEFYEERWFASGLGQEGKEINLCGQTVPFGTDVIFECENMPNLCIGLEI